MFRNHRKSYKMGVDATAVLDLVRGSKLVVGVAPYKSIYIGFPEKEMRF